MTDTHGASKVGTPTPRVEQLLGGRSPLTSARAFWRVVTARLCLCVEGNYPAKLALKGRERVACVMRPCQGRGHAAISAGQRRPLHSVRWSTDQRSCSPSWDATTRHARAIPAQTRTRGAVRSRRACVRSVPVLFTTRHVLHCSTIGERRWSRRNLIGVLRFELSWPESRDHRGLAVVRQRLAVVGQLRAAASWSCLGGRASAEAARADPASRDEGDHLWTRVRFR